jgi:hypothetical protein
MFAGGCGSGGGGGGPLQNEVRGIVRDSANSDLPVGGATVTIGGASATTLASDGSFVIRGASLGSSTATVTVPGQPAQTIAFEPPVGPGTLEGVILTLNIGQIRGRVLLANLPVDDALVTETGTAFPYRTNADGRFLIENVPAGATTVVAVAGGSSKTVNVTVVNGLNDIGNIVLENDPSPNPPGPPPGTLIGKITLADQASPTAGAGTVVFLLRNGIQIEQALTNPNAEFSFYALPGAGYSVLVRKNAYQDKASGVFEITNPAVPLRIDLTLDPN